MDARRTILTLTLGGSVIGVALGLVSNHRSTTMRLQELERRLAEVTTREEEPQRPTERLTAYFRAHAEVKRREIEEETEDAVASREEGAPRERRLERSRERPRSNQSPVEDFAPLRDVMEAEFVAEQADPAWALEAKRLVHNGLLEQVPEGSQIQEIDCRSQMCRVESTHMNRDSANRMVELALLDPEKRPWNGSFSTGLVREDEVGGPVTMVTYFMREGRGLPDAPSEAEEDWN